MKSFLQEAQRHCVNKIVYEEFDIKFESDEIAFEIDEKNLSDWKIIRTPLEETPPHSMLQCVLMYVFITHQFPFFPLQSKSGAPSNNTGGVSDSGCGSSNGPSPTNNNINNMLCLSVPVVP